jgi:P27 family predicted phage terminase small subunit
LLRGDRRDRINFDEPQPGEAPPEPPPGRDADWLAVWDRHCAQLTAMKLGPYAADQDALVALCDATVRYHALAAVVLKAPAVVRGPDGTPVAPKVADELRRASTELAKWLTLFGMTPSARSQLRSRLVGPASAPAAPGSASRLLSVGGG